MRTLRAIAGREAARIADAGGLRVALPAHGAVLLAFMMSWGRGVGAPLIDGFSVYEQLHVVRWAVLLCLLPWAAARCVAPERGNGAVRMAAMLGIRPSLLLTARIGVVSMAMLLVTAAGVPLVVIAQRMSDTAAGRVLTDEIAIVGFALAVAVTVVALQQIWASRVAVWLSATALSLAVAAFARSLTWTMPALGVAAAALAAVSSALLALRSDAALRYLDETAA